jgi:hypothetical protein
VFEIKYVYDGTYKNGFLPSSLLHPDFRMHLGLQLAFMIIEILYFAEIHGHKID